MKKLFSLILIFIWCIGITTSAQQNLSIDIDIFHEISSHDLLEYVSELSHEKFGGRLSGSPGYEASAQWVADHLKEWGLQPGAGNNSFFQWFPNAWTEVLEPGSVKIMPLSGSGEKIWKLKFPDDFFPGSNSASGNISGDVVYAGFGISAPELNYDDYSGLDVKGKIVMIESGVPYTRNDSALSAWEPYSYHRYKFQRAHQLGAAGLLYVGLTANPNTLYLEGFVYAHISVEVADEILKGTGHKFTDLKAGIIKAMSPSSFSTGRRVALFAKTRHYPEARSCNVIGMIKGYDPLLKHEAIIVGAHLDGVGSPGMVFPGALDNSSGVANIMGMAKVMASSAVKPARTVIFVFFGGEECGLYGSKAFVDEHIWPKENSVLMINLDMVGNGTGFHLSGGLSYPHIYKHFESANQTYLNRSLLSSEVGMSFGRPRTDGAVFEKAGYPTLQLWTTGTVKPVYYHHPLDNIDSLTPEIMEDAVKLLYIGILGFANQN